jgi:YegS/Rv2252/BmrU family lipid kinase
MGVSVGVVAHVKKRLGGGLAEFREALERAGIKDPFWYEVRKSRNAPAGVRKAARRGVDVLFVWGGDGMVQRCIDAVDRDPVAIAIIPAGTGNLLAHNLGIPLDIEGAVDVGLHGARRSLDVGRINGERFAVMAGAGFDAMMIRDADRALKDRLGRAAYVWTGAKHLRERRFTAKVRVDGSTWFSGKAGCVLVGNIGQVVGGIDVFEGATPDDGLLDVGVVTANGVTQWARALVRAAAGSADRSPFVQTTQARKVRVKLDREVAYELDGGAKRATDRLKIRIEPAAVTVCVPADEPEGGRAA